MWSQFSDLPSREIEAIGALGIYEVDLKRGTWRGSPNFLQIFGFERADEYPVEDFVALVHPEDRPGLRAHFQHCLENEDSFNTSYRCIVQGQEMLVETKTRIYRDDGGEAIRLLGVKRDITDQRSLRVAFEASPSGMLLTDRDHRIVLMNGQIETIFGYSRSELLSQSIEMLIPEEAVSRHRIYSRQYMEKPESRPMGVGRDLYGKRKDGSLVPVEIGLHPVYMNPEVLIICTVVDITERARMSEKLEKRNQELKDFAYRVAHDVRSPLTGLIELLKLNESDEELMSTEEVLSMVSRVAGDLLQLTDDIIASTLKRQETLQTKRINFAETRKRMEDRYQFQIIESGVTLTWQENHSREPALPRGLLEEILGNLISNALKYCDSREPEVRIQTRSDNTFFHVSVSDNGSGLPEDQRHRVFQIFTRFHETRASGTGLGLYLVKENVERVGGSIDFISGKEGTTFRLQFPLMNEQSAP